MAFKSKYTGPQVEGLLDQMASGDGFITIETDPIFLSSPAADITGDNIQTWNSKQDAIADLQAIRDGAAKGATALQSIPDNYVTEGTLTTALGDKVDKVEGKQLSTEDFTTILKQKLEGLNNYDDTAINQALQGLQTQVNTLVSGNASTAIESFNEIVAFLDGITDSQDLDSIIASIEQQIAGKMNNVTLAAVATSGSYNDLKDKPTIPECTVIDSSLSTTSTNAVQNKVVTAELNNKGTYSKPSGGIPKSDLESAVQTSLGKADTALQSYTEQYKGTVTGVKINGTTKNPSSGVVDLGTVITAHQDISGKQDKLVSGANIKNVYPSNGDASILGSGELHLASVLPNTSKVVATGIWHDYDIVNISIEGLEFIPEEATLMPGWSIHRNGDGSKFLSDDGTYKTISSSGSIDTSNFVTSVKVDNVSKTPSSGVVDLGYINKQLSTSTSSSMTLSPNIYYRNTSTSLSTLTITLGGVSNSGILNEYFVEFTTRSSGTTVSLPSTIKWANGETPTFDASTTYQISIVNNLGTIQKFK